MKEKVKKTYDFLKENIEWIIALVCLIIFLETAFDIWEKEIMREDIAGYNFISKYLIRDSVTPIMKFFTYLGSAFGVVPILIFLVIIIKEKKRKLLIPINLVLVTLFNQILKRIVQRPRPVQYRIIDASGYSFPSGHSMVSMAFFGYIMYLIYKGVENKIVKWLSIGIIGMCILLIGISRIYLGVHYTSDVISGFMLSIVYLVLFIKISNRIIQKNS